MADRMTSGDGEKLRRIMIRVRRGPAWDGGSVREQPGWDEHAAFVDDLVDRGIMVMGGPFTDHSGSIQFYEGVSEEEARRIAQQDPWIANGVFVLEEVRSWNVIVDELATKRPK
jgi:uncharacterized protein YciI